MIPGYSSDLNPLISGSRLKDSNNTSPLLSTYEYLPSTQKSHAPICVRANEKFAPSSLKIFLITSCRLSGSRCASTKAEDSVNEDPIPSIVCFTLSGSIFIVVPSAIPDTKRTFSFSAILSPFSEVR